ncbi:MAG: hypothetical protein ACP6KW_05380 [Candidatus Thorarchaeota archaeon]
MVDVRSQIEDYLDLLDMKHSWNENAGVFELVFSERKDDRSSTPDTDESSFRYVIHIHPGEKWIQIFTDVYSLDSIPETKRTDVLIDLLAANRKYAEVCFDYDEARRIIGTSQEMMVQGLNFDGFREEFLAVPWAVRQFWTEIAKKHGLK